MHHTTQSGRLTINPSDVGSLWCFENVFKTMLANALFTFVLKCLSSCAKIIFFYNVNVHTHYTYPDQCFLDRSFSWKQNSYPAFIWGPNWKLNKVSRIHIVTDSLLIRSTSCRSAAHFIIKQLKVNAEKTGCEGIELFVPLLR